MRASVSLAALLVMLRAVACCEVPTARVGPAGGIVMENQYFIYAIRADGGNERFVDRRTGRNYAAPNAPCAHVKRPDYGGAQFGSIDERNLVVEIGQDLQQYTQANNRYQVFITRDTQSWSPVFTDYFKNDWNAIIAWEKTSRQNAPKLAALGASTVPTVDHNSAPADVALRLYGITKWANENSSDGSDGPI